MPTNNSINTPKPIDVSSGGTGQSTLTTANGILAAGTTATGAIQNIGTGSVGQVLTSNGTSLPSFQAASSGALVLLSSQDLAGLNTVTFNNFVDNTVYMGYTCKLYGTGPTGGGQFLTMQISTDNGATFLSSGYDTNSFQFSYGASSTPFNWISSTTATEATLGFFFTNYMSNFDIELLPFGENTYTAVRSAASGSAAQVYAGFQHATGLANAFKLSVPGTITTGRASVYGYKK